MNRAARKDSAGADIYEGEVIAHASGERGKVIFRHDKTEVADQWRVDYDDGGPFSSLMLQCGDKGGKPWSSSDLPRTTQESRRLAHDKRVPGKPMNESEVRAVTKLGRAGRDDGAQIDQSPRSEAAMELFNEHTAEDFTQEERALMNQAAARLMEKGMGAQEAADTIIDNWQSVNTIESLCQIAATRPTLS